MERPPRKGWDPACPQCQEAVQRELELSSTLFDDLDHAAGKGVPIEDRSCDHETPKRD